jgi:hypothetical protein
MSQNRDRIEQPIGRFTATRVVVVVTVRLSIRDSRAILSRLLY